MRTLTATLTVLALTACAPDLRTDYPFDGQVSSGPLVVTTPEANDAGFDVTIDATNKGSQVYFDIDLGREMKVDEAFSTNAWDLAFKRYEVSMNGGAGNPTGVVEVAVLKGVDYDGLGQVPASANFLQDGAGPVFNTEEGGWYTYDLGKHQLVTRDDLVYVVKSSDAKFYKLKMLSYYDGNGTPASISLKYAPISPRGP
jgi:hypothetical protein